MGAVTLREERQSLTIDGPEAIAELCSEMRFLDRESIRLVLLNAKQHLIKALPSAKAPSMSRSPTRAKSLSPRSSILPIPSSGCTITERVLCRIRFYAARITEFTRTKAFPDAA